MEKKGGFPLDVGFTPLPEINRIEKVRIDAEQINKKKQRTHTQTHSKPIGFCYSNIAHCSRFNDVTITF